MEWKILVGVRLCHLRDPICLQHSVLGLRESFILPFLTLSYLSLPYLTLHLGILCVFFLSALLEGIERCKVWGFQVGGG